MPFNVSLADAGKLFPEYAFIKALTASEQKAAFHVQDKDGQDLCLKIVNPDFGFDRIPREVEAMTKVSHFNVAEFVEHSLKVTKEASRHYIIEKFVEGTDLSDQLGKPWETARAVEFFGQLLDGLSELKRANVVHRDLKPSNIRVRPDGSPVIIDFGLARLLDQPALTKTGAMVGTPLYFAPEQFLGDRNSIDHRTDLFPVGILLYHALVGHHPFASAAATATDLISLGEAVRQAEEHLNHPNFKKVPSGLQLVVKRLLSKQRETRFNDAVQAATTLRKAGGVA